METNKARPEYWTDAIERDILEPDKITIHLSHLRQTLIRRAPDPRLTALEAQVRELREVLETRIEQLAAYAHEAWSGWMKYQEKMGGNDPMRSRAEAAERRAEALEAENERLQEALHEAATSLETISKLAGRDEMLEDMMQIRGYANSRARVAFAGLDAAPHLGAAAMSPELLGQQPPAPEPQSEVKPHPCGHM